MGFLGIRDKTDSGLKPIVQRAPATPASSSAVSAHLVQPKAVVRPPAPTVRDVPPSPPRVLPVVRHADPPPTVSAPSAPAPAVLAVARPPSPPPSAPSPAVAANAVRALGERVHHLPVKGAGVHRESRVEPHPPARRGEDLAHLRRGVVHQARGEHPAAIEAFTRAIAADPLCIEAYASRGISREAMGDVDGARADYAKSIEVEVREEIARHLGR